MIRRAKWLDRENRPKKVPRALNRAGPKFGGVVGDVIDHPIIDAIHKIQHGQGCVRLRRTNDRTCGTYVSLTEILD
jgi:hypothetical protein